MLLTNIIKNRINENIETDYYIQESFKFLKVIAIYLSKMKGSSLKLQSLKSFDLLLLFNDTKIKCKTIILFTDLLQVYVFGEIEAYVFLK